VLFFVLYIYILNANRGDRVYPIVCPHISTPESLDEFQ
jgi:hypothetical protein